MAVHHEVDFYLHSCKTFGVRGVIYRNEQTWEILFKSLHEQEYFMLCLIDDDLFKIETCWRCDVLSVKLQVDVARLVSCNKMLRPSQWRAV